MARKSFKVNFAKWVIIILIAIAIAVVGWYLFKRTKEGFELAERPTTDIPIINPDPVSEVTPLKLRNGHIKVDNTEYKATFALIKIGDKQFWVMAIPSTENSATKYGYANSEIGSYYGYVNEDTMIYLQGNKLRTNKNNKFVTGKKIGEYVGLKEDANGSEITFKH